MSQTFLFKAIDGKMSFGSLFNEARLRQNLRENEGKVYRIEQEVNTRTLSQNKLYWKYLGIISMETGDDEDSLHELFRRTLLPPKFIRVMGQEIKVPASTTELKKHEFADYLERICAKTSIPIPDTESYLREIDLAPMN